jgi:hypothetical protein
MRPMLKGKGILFSPPFIHVELYFEILDAIDACEWFGVGNPKST